jgi:endonuclease/exonuclease/phosphatase (EEP) superfamily protein YafD
MAGDFNASRTDAGFARLLRGSGFADAADGRGLLPTWPSSKAWIWPVLRLDHVLVSRGIGVAGVRVLGPTGSDHRAVVADLRL